MGKFIRAQGSQVSVDDYFAVDADTYAFKFVPSPLGVGYQLQSMDG